MDNLTSAPIIPTCSCAHDRDGAVTSTLFCSLHNDEDPCGAVVRITGKRRKGSIKNGVCTACGWAEVKNFLVYTETHDGVITAELKSTQRAATMAYNKLARGAGNDLKEFGWSRIDQAGPRERVAAGLSPFPPSKF